MNRPKISVLVLTYNQESTIGRALRSVEARCAGTDYEIIVGDDCSTDSTRAICEEAAERNPRIRLMPPAPNKGLVGNYFSCLAAARGEYIGDCAGDDEWLAEAPLAEAIAMLDADPSFSVVFSDCETIGAHSPPPAAEGRMSGESVLRRVLNHVDSLPYMLSAAIYRKSALEAAMARRPDIVCMPDTGIEDLPIIAALAAEGDAAHLPGRGLRYYVADGSVSNSTDPERQTRFYSRALECTRRLCEFYGVGQREVAEMFRAKAKYIAGMAYRSRSREMLELVERTLRPWSLPRPLSTRIRLAMLRATLLLRKSEAGQ